MSRSLGAIRKNGSNSYRALSKKQTFRSLTPYGPPTILFHRETLRLLGIHCFGYQASEIIHIGQAIIKANSYQLQGLSR